MTVLLIWPILMFW